METNEKNNLTENTIVSFNINDAIKGKLLLLKELQIEVYL